MLASAGLFSSMPRIKPSFRKESLRTPCITFRKGEYTAQCSLQTGQGSNHRAARARRFSGRRMHRLRSTRPHGNRYCTTRCSVLKIEKKVMLRTLHEEHRFSDIFVAYVVQPHNHTQADL